MIPTIRTVVGTGEAGYTGDGGSVADGALCESFMCSFDAAGNLFYARFATTSCSALSRLRES